jgi:hypothetical protein
MPSISAYTLETWHREHPCPESGSGTRAVHNWILSAANASRSFGRSPDQASDFIASAIVGCGRHVSQREIQEAVEKAYNAKVDGGGTARPKWPEADLDLIEKIVADANGFGIADLQERSPIRFSDELSHSAEVVEALLGCDDETLVCIGPSSYEFTTDSFTSLKGQLPQAQFIVPSPMSARIWKKDTGELSAKGNANTGPRRNIVVEFDITKLDKAGKPTQWAPLIDRWEAAGITVKDAMAALIWHLKQTGPLVCVVDSAGKSLHAWFYCAGESEEPGSKLRKFFEYAVAIGADPATWTRSQFVRMPDGKRDNGKRQTVLYFDRDVATQAGNHEAAGTPRNNGAKNNTESTNISEERQMKTEEQNRNGLQTSGKTNGGMTNEEIDKLADEGAELLSYDDYCRHVLLEGTPDAISLDAATKELAWKQHAACLAKAKNEDRRSTLNLEEYVQQAKKMGERTQATWQKFLPLKANISDLLKAWMRMGQRLQTWTKKSSRNGKARPQG